MCGQPRQPKSTLVQLGVTARASKPRPARPAKAKAESTPIEPKPKRFAIVEDFHCSTCGPFLHDRPMDYYHHCHGPRPIAYQLRRAAICDGCEHNADGVCEIVRARELEKGNDKPGLIAIGVTLPMVRCPIGLWPAVTVRCPGCQRLNSEPSGPKKCRYCGLDIG